MPNWSGSMLTTKGQTLQAKVDAGTTTLALTKMKIGSGTLADGQSIASLTDLISPQQNVGISAISASNNITTITGVITNTGLTTGFYVRELGLFAKDTDDSEILYAMIIDSSPDYLPPEGDSVTVSEEFAYNIIVSNASSVTATINQTGLVTSAILEQHNVSTAAHADLLHLWQASKVYAVGDICYSATADSYKRFECTIAGTTGTTEPTWPVVGQTVTDGSVAWMVVDIRHKEIPEFKNNVTTVTSNTAATITADYGVLINSSGNTVRLSGISQSISTAASGAGGLDTSSLAPSTWYYVYIVYGTAGTSAIISASQSAPTLPSGYTYYARAGTIRTDSNSYLYRTIQRGRKVHYVLTPSTNTASCPIVVSGVQGSISTPTFIAASISSFIPPIASHIVLQAHSTNGNVWLIAPNANSAAWESQPSAYYGGSGGSAAYLTIPFTMPLESTNIYVASMGSSNYLFCLGWEEEI